MLIFEKHTLIFAAIVSLALIPGCAAPQHAALSDNSVYLTEPLSVSERNKPEVPDGPISLEEAIEFALKYSPEVRRADIGIKMGEDGVLLAKSNFLPKLSVQANYHRIDVAPATVIPGFGKVSFSPREITNTSTSMIVPVYTFGKNDAAYRQALRTAEAAEFDATRARQGVIAAASQAYFRVLEAYEFKNVIEKSTEQIKAQLDVAESFFKQGMVTRNDVLSAKVALLQMEHELLRAQSNIEIATANLNRITGLPISHQTQLSSKFAPVDIDLTEEECLTTALMFRPELGSLDRQRKASVAAIAAAKAARYPTINFATSWNWTSNPTTAKKHDWTVDLIGEWTPFAGFAITDGVIQSRHALQQLDEVLRELIDVIALEIKTVYLNLLQSRKRIDVAKEALKQAEENLRIFKEQYSQGLVTSTDVLNAESKYARIRADLTQALYENNAAVVNLENAMARTIEDVLNMRTHKEE